jgi:KDO2-lipid IV(A) lauroyltransferase
VSTRLRHRLEHLGFRAARVASGVLPERLALAGGAGLGAVAGGVLRLRRSDVERHLEWAFPEQGKAWRRRIASACYRHFGREAVTTLRALRWSAEQLAERTRMIGFDDFRAAVAAGDGVVLLTGHLGNWELGGAAIAARGVPLDVVGKGMSNPRFERDLFALRARLGMSVIEMGEAPRLALRSLAAGRVVALLGDQSAHGGGPLLPFFGRPAVTARGPALFAVRSGAPVFVAFALRDAGASPRYTVTFERLPLGATDDTETDILSLTRHYTGALEGAIRRAPAQYFWQHRRWKGAPAEEPASEAQVITGRPHP